MLKLEFIIIFIVLTLVLLFVLSDPLGDVLPLSFLEQIPFLNFLK